VERVHGDRAVAVSYASLPLPHTSTSWPSNDDSSDVMLCYYSNRCVAPVRPCDGDDRLSLGFDSPVASTSTRHATRLTDALPARRVSNTNRGTP